MAGSTSAMSSRSLVSARSATRSLASKRARRAGVKQRAIGLFGDGDVGRVVRRHAVANGLRVFGVRMGAAKDEGVDPLRKVFCEAEADPAAHRIAEEARSRQTEIVENRDDVGGA